MVFNYISEETGQFNSNAQPSSNLERHHDRYEIIDHNEIQHKLNRPLHCIYSNLVSMLLYCA